MNWFRKKKEPEVIHHKYDIVPPFDWENATSETAIEYFKTLTRIQLLELEDRDTIPEHLWDYYYDVLREHKCWPTDEEVSKVCKEVKWNSDSLLKQFPKLKEQVEGMQKKLDRIVGLFEKAEVCMTGKDALQL